MAVSDTGIARSDQSNEELVIRQARTPNGAASVIVLRIVDAGSDALKEEIVKRPVREIENITAAHSERLLELASLSVLVRSDINLVIPEPEDWSGSYG